MLLALSVISEQGAALGPTAYKVFDEKGGTIGRIAGNDWVLPDAQNFVSSRHARIVSRDGTFYLEDTSSNGTFINAPDVPASRTEPVPLKDGDRLFIGDYEIIVQLIGGARPEASVGLGTVDPLAALGAERSQPRAAPMPLASMPTVLNATASGQDPASASAGASGAGFAASGAGVLSPAATPLAAGAGSTGAAFPTAAGSNAAAAANPVSGSAAAAPAMPSASAPAAGADTGMASLLSALGLDPSRVDPAIQQQLGAILRLTVHGLVEVLKSRAEVKNSFRLQTTSIRPVENNPLKFSMNAEDAVYNLFMKRNPGYLGPVEAFQEGFDDVNHHQAAVFAGIRAGFNAMLAKLHPTHLEEVYERKLRRTAMLGLGGKLRYWELYRTQFEEIDRDREASFQLLFGEEFARAYNEHLQKLAADARLRKPR